MRALTTLLTTVALFMAACSTPTTTRPPTTESTSEVAVVDSSVEANRRVEQLETRVRELEASESRVRDEAAKATEAEQESDRLLRDRDEELRQTRSELASIESNLQRAQSDLSAARERADRIDQARQQLLAQAVERDSVSPPPDPVLEFVEHGEVLYVRARDGRYAGRFDFEAPAGAPGWPGQVRHEELFFHHFGKGIFADVIGNLKLVSKQTIDGVEATKKKLGEFDLGTSDRSEDFSVDVTAPEEFQRVEVRVEAELDPAVPGAGTRLVGKYAFEREKPAQWAGRLASEAQGVVGAFGGVLIGIAGTYAAVRGKLIG